MTEKIEKNEEKKPNFFKKLAYSITKFEKYPDMAAEGLSSAFKYLAILMLIFSIIVGTGFIYKLHDTISKGIDYFANEFPEITYKDGKLDVDSKEPITINTGEMFIDKIIIDTKTESEEKITEYINSIPTENTGVIVLNNKILVITGGTSGNVEYTYPEVLNNIANKEINELTKQDILKYVTGAGTFSLYGMFFVLMVVYVFIVYSISVLVDTLLIAILGSITLLFTKLKLKFGAVYNMSVYALTLPILLNAVYITINSITGFKMDYFQIMYTSIAYVYLVAAILMIKSDFIKKQAELMKIMQEQEKVRQEMQEKEEQEQEEEKKKNKKPEEKEKDKKEEEPKTDTEPDGSEA